MCPCAWQVGEGKDRTPVLPHPPRGKVHQIHSRVYPFTPVLSFPILLLCLPWEVALGCQSRVVTLVPQGAEPRGLGAWGAACAPCPHLQRSKTALTCSRSRKSSDCCPHQQDLHVGSPGQRLGTCQATVTSLVATTRNPSGGSPGVTGTCSLRFSQKPPAAAATSTARGRGAGAPWLPAAAVGMALCTCSFPSPNN